MTDETLQKAGQIKADLRFLNDELRQLTELLSEDNISDEVEIVIGNDTVFIGSKHIIQSLKDKKEQIEKEIPKLEKQFKEL